MKITDQRLTEIIAAAETPIPPVPPDDIGFAPIFYWVMRKHGTIPMMLDEAVELIREVRRWREVGKVLASSKMRAEPGTGELWWRERIKGFDEAIRMMLQEEVAGT